MTKRAGYWRSERLTGGGEETEIRREVRNCGVANGRVSLLRKNGQDHRLLFLKK